MKASAKKPGAHSRPTPSPIDYFSRYFPLALGLVIGLALLKFGNPVILNRQVARPEDSLGWMIQPWPIQIGWFFAAVIFALSFKKLAWRDWRAQPVGFKCLLAAPIVWLAWNGLASAQSVAPPLTRLTMGHFLFTTLMFYLGFFGMAQFKPSKRLAVPIIACFFLMLWAGFRQHYGGLEATREFFYAQPGWVSASPEFLQKIGSDRIFGTLVYPNALAGVIILLGPFVLVESWLVTERWRPIWRLLLVGALGYMSAACLYWTGSKSGWLIVLALSGIALLMLPSPRALKFTVVAIALIAGLTFFWMRYAPYFKEGAPSVAARFDYWRAAWDTGRAQPILGSGPGTFSVVYAEVKPPEAEMARLTHNDYLEQWSDAGVIAAVAYLTIVIGSLWALGRKLKGWRQPVELALWLGVLGWGVQSIVEFGLYIPALAWPAFLFMGWGCGMMKDEIPPTAAG